MRNVIGLVVLCATASTSFLFGQSAGQDLVTKMMPKPVATSPNVAALGKYGDYSVSHFTGLPEIAIPIFEVRSGNLSIPISLNYHASGIKPTEVASWVGAGWSLSTGGQISRSVNGRADESAGNGYMFDPLHPSPTLCGSFGYLHNAANNITDTEPDIFNYLTTGVSGKFMMLYGSTPYLFPYAPIQVTATSGLNTFQIIDANGIVNVFGENSASEFSFTQSGPNLTTGARSAWHLTKMSAPNSNDEITISYQDIGSFSMHDISYSYTITDACVTMNGATCPPEQTVHPQRYDVTSSGDQKGPSTITFPTGMVKFFLKSTARLDQPNLKALDRIEIQDPSGSVLKTIQFVYSYFTSPGGGSAALKLDAVQFKDAAGVVVQSYKLTYFTNTVSWKRSSPLAYGDLHARDLWGYYNGATGNTNLLAPQTIPYVPNVGPPTTISFGGATNRSVNTAFIKEGVLQKITFPTGGYTEFDFEANKYLNGSTPTLTGGLRVTKIESSDGSSALPIVKTYKYGANESGYGDANFWPFQFNYNSSLFSKDASCINPYPEVQLRIRSYQSAVAYSYQSSPVRYTHVTEYIGEPGSTTLGKVSYIFDEGLAINDNQYITFASGKFWLNDLAWKRGKLTNKTVFDHSGNKISEFTISYSNIQAESRHVGYGVHQYYPIIVSTCGDAPGLCETEDGRFVYLNSMYWIAYYQDAGAMRETSRVEKIYQNGDASKVVTTTQTHAYHPEKLQPVQSTTTRSNTNQNLVTVYKYPFEFSGNVTASSTGEAKGIYMLNLKNILTLPLETYTYLQSATGTNKRVVSAQLTTFVPNNNNANHVVADEVFLFESDQPLTLASFAPMAVNVSSSGITKDLRYKQRIKFVNYDAASNITQATKIKDVPVAFQYGYNNTLPVAEAANAENRTGYVEFKYVSFDDMTGAGIVTGPLLPHSGRKYFQGDYTVSFTRPNTRSYIIEYFYYNTSTSKWTYISKPYATTSMTLTEGSAIDHIRIRPADAPMSTYTYDLGKGVTSVTDPNGVTSYYQYDNFGRLLSVSDTDRNILSLYDYHYYKP